MEWPRVPLGDVCDVTIGATPARNRPEYWGGSHVWMTVGELDGGTVVDSREHITAEGVANSSSKLIPAGTLLFSFKLSIGKMAFAGADLYTNEAIAALPVRDPEVLDSKYLYYSLSALDTLANVDVAAKGKVLNKAKLKQLRILLPPVSEQRRIVELLDQADHLLRLRTEADTKADRILPALFLKMFGDPATNPMGWPVVPFEAVFHDITSRCPKIQRKRYRDAGRFPVVDQGKQLIAGFTDDEDLRQAPERPVVVFGDHTRIVKYVDFPFVAGADGSRVFAVDDSCTPEFASQLLRLQPIPDLGYSRHMRALKRMLFMAPPVEMQTCFSSAHGAHRQLLPLRTDASTQIQRLWDTILGRAFSGSLTASWRQAHMKELLQEMELQAKTLTESAL